MTAALIGCFFIQQSSYTWREELRTNNVKAKTCLFTGQLEVQHMPFTYVTLYNPQRILAITNLETENKTNKPRKTMLCTILLELLLLFRQFKKTANILWTMISAQTLHENKTKWWVAPKRKTGAAAKHPLKQTADCTALQSQIDWTMEPLNQKSQIAQEYGLLPADARQQSLTYCFLVLELTWDQLWNFECPWFSPSRNTEWCLNWKL